MAIILIKILPLKCIRIVVWMSLGNVKCTRKALLYPIIVWYSSIASLMRIFLPPVCPNHYLIKYYRILKYKDSLTNHFKEKFYKWTVKNEEVQSHFSIFFQKRERVVQEFIHVWYTANFCYYQELLTFSLALFLSSCVSTRCQGKIQMIKDE